MMFFSDCAFKMIEIDTQILITKLNNTYEIDNETFNKMHII